MIEVKKDKMMVVINNFVDNRHHEVWLEFINYGNLKFILFLVFCSLSFGLSTIMLLLSQKLGVVEDDKNKLASYECGFEPFSQGQLLFDVQYYILGILFILFDIEVFFIFSWSVCLKYISFAGFFAMLGFLCVLLIGFVYEWRLGVLEWKNTNN